MPKGRPKSAWSFNDKVKVVNWIQKNWNTVVVDGKLTSGQVIQRLSEELKIPLGSTGVLYYLLRTIPEFKDFNFSESSAHINSWLTRDSNVKERIEALEQIAAVQEGKINDLLTSVVDLQSQLHQLVRETSIRGGFRSTVQ